VAFSKIHVSLRPLLARASDEDEVQKWLAEQPVLRTRGRYHVHREAQIARNDRPDVIISSSAASVEVAIEAWRKRLDMQAT
jgi:hypothetical protein